MPDTVNWWRLAATLGIVVVAVATVCDLYWHQTHPMDVRASMASLPHIKRFSLGS